MGTPRDPSTERAVAFLDVLGFSQLVKNNEHDVVVKAYDALVTSTLMGLSRGKFSVAGTGADARALPDLSDARLNVLIVSDSVIAYSDSAGMTAIVDLLAFAGAAVATGFYVGMPLRGGVALGRLSEIGGSPPSSARIEVRSLVGRGLLDAHDLERRQEWSGAVVADAVVQHYADLAEAHGDHPDIADVDYLVAAHLLARAQVPRKAPDASSVAAWTVPWPWHNRDRPTDTVVRHAFEMHNRDPAPATRKIDNTIAYLQQIRPAGHTV